MSFTRTITVHPVAEDGLPDMRAEGAGRVAFIRDGCVVSGWPVISDGMITADPLAVLWEPSQDGFGGPVAGVTHWIEFDVPAWALHDPGDQHHASAGES